VKRKRARRLPILRKRELKQMLPEEREKKLTELRTELVHLRTMVASGGTVENPGRIREIRRTIARLLTIEAQTQKQGASAK
jgi:large subunit ribosomal protein L29